MEIKDYVPKFNELMMPVFRVLKSLGGSGKNDEFLITSLLI